jgi:putative transposon-encoded protein
MKLFFLILWWHDKRIKKKSFILGDKVLLFNSRVKLFGHGKL